MDEIDRDDERDNTNRQKSKYPKCSHCGTYSQLEGKCPFCGKGIVR